ncbi:MAG: hypothetical protein K6C32_00830 [Bacilli bacterium]|nr:hypothetical protein [Bacilli bacterium]
MKKRLFLLPLIAINLTGCFLFEEEKETVTSFDKTIPVYYLDQHISNSVDNPVDLKNQALGQYSFRYIENQEYVPYLTVKTYTQMLSHLLDEKYEFKTYDGKNYAQIRVMEKEKGSLVFLAQIYTKLNKVMFAGNISTGLVQEDYSSTSLMKGLFSDEKILSAGGYHNFYYDHLTFRHEKETYYPLSLLDAAFSESASYFHVYDYEEIFQFSSTDDLANYYITNSEPNREVLSTPEETMKRNITNKFNNVMPDYIKEDRKNSYFFLMENLYGLKSIMDEDDWDSRFHNQGLITNFMSDSAYTRTEALWNVMANLNDGHTGMTRSNAPWSEGTFDSNGPLWQHRKELRTQLTLKKEGVYVDKGVKYGGILYSEDHEVAFLAMEAFRFIYDAFNEDGSFKEEVYQSDDFYRLASMLDEVKASGTKKVVIDLSTNGGGVLGVMMKILCLLSKNAKSELYLAYLDMDTYVQDNLSVDTNNDQKIDEDDCYGDDLDIYLLTSEYSFSCGNALPYFARKNGFVKIIGQNSGGGECSVAEHILPTGEPFRHSSLLHLGWVANNKWEGDEKGAGVDIPLDYENYYDIEYLATLLK